MGEKKKKMAPTLTEGVAKVPVVMQLEALECGAACLTMIMAYYGKWVPLEQVRMDCGVSRDGSKARNILRAARQYGMSVEAFRQTPESLQKDGKYPCIIHWNMNHFVVLDGFKGDKYAVLNDPARGTVKVTMEEFNKSFTGIVLIPTPSEAFEQGGKRKSTWSYAKEHLRGSRSAMIFFILTSIILYLFGIIRSVTSRIFMDRLLTGRDLNWLTPFILFLLMFAVIQLTVAWTKAIYNLKINGKMTVTGSTSYMWKVLRLPMPFFSQRLAGDIQGRLSLNASISATLVKTYAPLLLNTVMMVFYLVLMLNQSLLLTLVGIGSYTLNAVVSLLISRRRVNKSRVRMRDNAKLESTTVTGIDMIETIKAGGAENGFFQKWAGYQASVNAQDQKLSMDNRILGMIPSLISSIANYLVLILGVQLCMKGEFTIGAVMMFQGFLNSFMSPAMTLVSAGQTTQEMTISIERVEDVMQYPEDPAFTEGEAENTEIVKLKGEVELKNVTFGYSRLDEPLIKDLSISVKPGQRIAIVGASGCGKSTLSKLISGLYQPWSGEILLDGKPRCAYPRDILIGSLAVVDQDIILFEDTIENNIKMWDTSIKDFEMILAARDARVHDDIMQMPGGYKHKLASGGRNLSGGQRQRLEIARVLALDPSIIIMDEATSALDAKTEFEAINAIQNRGITCFVIAHRLSTVRTCDQIIVLDHGKIVEQGTHDELIKRHGAYADLVTNE